MMSTARTRYPFTPSQWQELEHQALIFKYMISGMPIPPHLLCIVRRSYDSSLLLHQPQHIGWSCFPMGSGRKIDPEPGRCRRTDGKKWRCSKEAYADSKYCERHMHRGRNRSRKPVELITTNSMSISSINRNSSPSPSTISPSSSHHSVSGLTALTSENHPFLYPQSSRTLGSSDLSSKENTSSTTNNLWESAAAYSHTGKSYSHGRERKEEVFELPFFSETSGTMRNISGTTSPHDSWQLNQLTMGSAYTNNLKQKPYTENGHSSFQFQSPDDNPIGLKHDYFGLDSDVKIKNDLSTFRFMEKDVQPKKVMHHFFDEWPQKEKDSWFDCEDDKISRNAASSKIQLSISMPNSADNLYFSRNNEK